MVLHGAATQQKAAIAALNLPRPCPSVADAPILAFSRSPSLLLTGPVVVPFPTNCTGASVEVGGVQTPRLFATHGKARCGAAWRVPPFRRFPCTARHTHVPTHQVVAALAFLGDLWTWTGCVSDHRGLQADHAGSNSGVCSIPLQPLPSHSSGAAFTEPVPIAPTAKSCATVGKSRKQHAVRCRTCLARRSTFTGGTWRGP